MFDDFQHTCAPLDGAGGAALRAWGSRAARRGQGSKDTGFGCTALNFFVSLYMGPHTNKYDFKLVKG